jgi:hypothetical protein
MAKATASASFDSFMHAWKRPFEQVQSALDVLKTFPQVEPVLHVELSSGDALTQQQYDWLKLQPKLGMHERSFFNPAWVPIERNGLDAFVDLTQERLPVFTTLYTPFNGGQWKRVPFADSMRTLLRAAPRSTDLMDLRERAERALLSAAQGDLFDGSLPNPADVRGASFLPDLEKLFLGSRIYRRIVRRLGNQAVLVVDSVSPLALMLFPPACEVSLDHFDFAPTLFDKDVFVPARPRGVATLATLLTDSNTPQLTLMSGTLHHPQFSVRFRWENGAFSLSQAPYQVLWYFDALIDLLRRDRKTAGTNQTQAGVQTGV